MGASPMWLPVTSMARISSVCSSTPMWILRHRRRFAPPCLRACHSPSPSALMPFGAALEPVARTPLIIDQKVQWPLRAPVGNTHSQGFLAPAQRAEIRHRPVEADEPQKALHEPGRLTERHAEEHLHRQARLDRGIAILWLPASLARRRRHPGHIRIEPDRQGAALLQRVRHCRSDHVWTAPAGQGLCSGQASGRSRPCVRRLICSTVAARPDEVRRRSGPNQWHALVCAPVRTGYPDCRVAVRLPSPHVAPHRLGAGRERPACPMSGRGGPVPLAGPDQRPDDPRHAVRQRDRDDLHGLSLQHAPEPLVAGPAAPPCADLRHRAEIE